MKNLMLISELLFLYSFPVALLVYTILKTLV